MKALKFLDASKIKFDATAQEYQNVETGMNVSIKDEVYPCCRCQSPAIYEGCTAHYEIYKCQNGECEFEFTVS